MSFSIRRLGPGDELILAVLAQEDADFDLEDRGKPHLPLSPEAARAYLADPGLLHWVAESDGAVLGFLYCHVLRKRAGDPVELLLYEIGVREGARRQQIGTALVAAMRAYMTEHQITEAWVLADNPEAVLFYRACEFGVAEDQPVYLTLEL